MSIRHITKHLRSKTIVACAAFAALRHEVKPLPKPASPNSVFAVIVRHADLVIGMGRLVGDGSLFLQIVDIAIDPGHQGRGLGKLVMAALMAHIAADVPAEVHVSLMADDDSCRLYTQFGFEPVAPRSQGMALWVNKA